MDIARWVGGHIAFGTIEEGRVDSCLSEAVMEVATMTIKRRRRPDSSVYIVFSLYQRYPNSNQSTLFCTRDGEVTPEQKQSMNSIHNKFNRKQQRIDTFMVVN